MTAKVGVQQTDGHGQTGWQLWQLAVAGMQAHFGRRHQTFFPRPPVKFQNGLVLYVGCEAVDTALAAACNASNGWARTAAVAAQSTS